MLAPALLTALAATLQAQAPAERPVFARAQAQVLVQIVQTAEVRGGHSRSPHQRTIRHDENGAKLVLLQFE